MASRKDATRKSPRSRLLPYKILSLLLFGKYLWLELQPNGTWKVGLGPLSRYVRTTPMRVKEQLEWLVSRNYLEAVTFEHGLAFVTMRSPPNSQAADIATEAITVHRADALEKVRRIVEETD